MEHSGFLQRLYLRSRFAFFEDYIYELQSNNRRQELRLEQFQRVAACIDFMIKYRILKYNENI